MFARVCLVPENAKMIDNMTGWLPIRMVPSDFGVGARGLAGVYVVDVTDIIFH